VKLTDLSQLGKAVAAQRLQQVLAGADASQRTALEELAAIGFGLVPPRKRPELATRYYTNAKADLGRGELTAVIGSLQAAHDLARQRTTCLRLVSDSCVAPSNFDLRFRGARIRGNAPCAMARAVSAATLAATMISTRQPVTWETRQRKSTQFTPGAV